MQEKCEKARGVPPLARELSCGLPYSPETENLLAGYPPETNEKKKQQRQHQKKKQLAKAYCSGI